MARRKKNNSGRTFAVILVLLLLLVGGVFFIQKQQQFSLIGDIFGEEKIIYSDYETLTFSDSNNPYCDGSDKEFEVVTQQVIVSEDNYDFLIDDNVRSYCDTNLQDQGYKEVSNGIIEVVKAGELFDTQTKFNKMNSFAGGVYYLCSNYPITSDETNGFIIGEKSILTDINDVIVNDGSALPNNCPSNMPYSARNDNIFSDDTFNAGGLDIVYKITNFNGQTYPVTLKYTIPQNQIPQDLHYREFSCPILEGYSLVSQTFQGGAVFSETYDVEDFEVEPNFFCKTNKAILSNSDVTQSEIPYLDLIQNGEFSVPSGESYTFFYVTNSNKDVPGVCSNANILTQDDCFVYLDQNINVLQLSIEESLRIIDDLQINADQKTELIKELNIENENQLLQIQDLGLTIEQQADIISNFETRIEFQAQYINDLNLTLEEQTQFINELTQNIEQQADIISQLTDKIDEQSAYILELTQNAQEQADFIERLSFNLAQKQEYINDLEAENEIQAQLIAEMRLSFDNQGEILSNLDNTIQDDAIIIQNLNLELEEQAQIISAMRLNAQEQAQLINSLTQELDDAKVIIDNLKLNNAELGEVISNLKLENSEMADLINQLTQNAQEQAEIILAMELSSENQNEVINDLTLEVEETQQLISELEEQNKKQKILYYSIGGIIAVIGGGLLLI